MSWLFLRVALCVRRPEGLCVSVGGFRSWNWTRFTARRLLLVCVDMGEPMNRLLRGLYSEWVA